MEGNNTKLYHAIQNSIWFELMNALYLEFSIYYFHTQVNHWLLRPWSMKRLREATVHSSFHYGRLTFTHKQARQSLEVTRDTVFPLTSTSNQSSAMSILSLWYLSNTIFSFRYHPIPLHAVLMRTRTWQQSQRWGLLCSDLCCVLIIADLTTDVKVSWSFSRFCPILENFKTRLFHIKNFSTVSMLRTKYSNHWHRMHPLLTPPHLWNIIPPYFAPYFPRCPDPLLSHLVCHFTDNLECSSSLS